MSIDCRRTAFTPLKAIIHGRIYTHTLDLHNIAMKVESFGRAYEVLEVGLSFCHRTGATNM